MNDGNAILGDAAPGAARVARWAPFDPIWYGAHYDAADPHASYLKFGARLRCSPNVLFDEAWYLERHPDVRTHVEQGLIPSGFDHYRTDGHRNRSPNAYFDEAFYRGAYPHLFVPGGVVARRGYANGFDHYLSEGAAQGLRPGPFFDEAVWRQCRPAHDPAEPGVTALEQYLRELRRPHLATEPREWLRTCWYFDPGWYARHHPDFAAEMDGESWISPLSHYLARADTGHDPGPFFDEAWYVASNRDVAEAVAAGLYRNGFAHFIAAGVAEGRSPAPGIDLAAFTDDRVAAEVAGGLFPDAYACLVADRSMPAGLLSPAELAGKRQFAAQARIVADAASSTRMLDFRLDPDEVPALSVVMVLHNQFDLTLSALASLHGQGCRVALILVDSGSTDRTRRIGDYVQGARVLRHDDNVGFILGGNAGLAEVRTDLVLFMNNDVTLGPGAVRAAIARIGTRPDAGAVGGRIVRSHGRLQEAGCTVWRDGRTTGYLRDASPDIAEAGFVREVDFCSGAFLLVRTAPMRALGGFNPAFLPAYYEDADLGMRLRAAGFVTLYDPAVLVFHYEYGSSSSAAADGLIAAARSTFCDIHAARLPYHYNYRGTEDVRARSSRRWQRRVLVIEDRIPRRHLGAGYVRSNDIVQAMDRLGHAVTVFPVMAEAIAPADARADFPDTVEVMYDRSHRTLAGFLAERTGCFDVLWIGRTHNLQRLLPTLAMAGGHIPDFGVVLDTEAVASPRLFAQHALDGAPDDRALAEALCEELACAGFCQRIVAVNEAEAALVAFAGHDRVSVLGHQVAPRPTASSFLARRGLLFVGSLHGAHTPNYDSLCWFLDEVLPRLAAGPGDPPWLTIAGHVGPGVDVSRFTAHRGVRFVGPVADLQPLYDTHRVFVAPTRFAAGIPYKVHEAASHGLPVVATSLLCGQLGWHDGVELMDGGDADPAAFARAVQAAYTDAGLWNGLRQAALRRIAADHDAEAYATRLGAILQDIGQPTPPAGP